MSSATPAHGDFAAGRVLHRSFALLAGDFAKIYALGALVATPLLPPLHGIFVAMDDPPVRRTVVRPRRIYRVHRVSRGMSMYGAMSLILGLAGQAALATGVVQRLRGLRFTLALSLWQSVRRLLPLTGLIFLMGVPVAIFLVPLSIAIMFTIFGLPLDALILAGSATPRAYGSWHSRSASSSASVRSPASAAAPA